MVAAQILIEVSLYNLSATAYNNYVTIKHRILNDVILFFLYVGGDV